MSSTCLNCKVIKQNTRKVPLWSMNEGNNSLLPEVIREKKYNPKKTELITESPKLTKLNVDVPIKTDKPDTWVFYWAAQSSSNPQEIIQEKDAYGNNSNHGIVKTDDKGNAILKLNCPQPYKEHEKGLTYPRHVHYTFLMKDNIWNENINSIVVMCNIDFKQMQKAVDKKTHIVLNALPGEEYDTIHIPNSYNIYYKFLEDMPEKDRGKYIESLLNEYIQNYPKLFKLLKKQKLSIFDIPIITYCDNIKCNASGKLAEYLIEANYINILEYPGGMKDWHENTKISEDDTISNIDLDDDEEIISYKGGKYLHHKDTNDVTNIDDFSLIGSWDPIKKKLTFLDKDKDNDLDKEIIDDKDKIDATIKSKYKDVITVIKGEPEILPEDGDDSNEESDDDSKESSEESDDNSNESSEEDSDSDSDSDDSEEIEESSSESDGEIEEIEEIEEKNMNGGKNTKNVIENKTKLSDYSTRGFNFF